jgi:hypothetical protein
MRARKEANFHSQKARGALWKRRRGRQAEVAAAFACGESQHYSLQRM